MKLEVGKLYKTKSQGPVKIIDKREIYNNESFLYLGVVQGENYEVFWYSEDGRLYDNRISPYDIEKELSSKVQFKSRFNMMDGKVFLRWPKKEILNDLINQNVKITIEILDK